MSNSNDMYLQNIEPLFRYAGTITLEVAGRRLTLDLRFKHERAYAAKILFAIHHPPADIDAFLFKRLVRPGDSVLDAGDHVGFTAIEILQSGAIKVIAVEPVPAIFERLLSIGGPGVELINKAISNVTIPSSLILSTLHNQGSSLNKAMTEIFPHVFGEKPQTIHVESTTIDEIVKVHGGFSIWKLDVEGAEADVMRGTAKTLATTPPRSIIVELYDRFFDEFFELAKPTHPFVSRAYISRDSYSLLLEDFRTQPGDQFHNTSPMYVFSMTAE